MAITSPSVDTFLLTAAAIILPTVYYIGRGHLKSPPHVPYRLHLTVLVLLHSVYTLYVLLVLWPPNIFKTLNLPINTSSDRVRDVLRETAGLRANATLPGPLDALLARISSLSVRTFYVRFGHEVMQDCEYCETFNDYLFFALPYLATDYLREAAVLGLLTARGSGRSRWRTYVVGALIGAAAAEGYFTTTTDVNIPPDGATPVLMLHDMLWALRQALFFLLPVLTHLLPAAPPSPNPLAAAVLVHGALEQAITRAATLRYAHGAVTRDPALRAAAGEWWDRQRVEGQWVREDEGVRRTAETLGRGFAEGGRGRLRTKARDAVATLRASLTGVPR